MTGSQFKGMLEVRATHKSGTGTASRNLVTQLPVIGVAFPEINGCHFGTINLELECPIIFIGYDHRTAPIAWDMHRPTVTEQFDLVRVTVELKTSRIPKPAWVYIPHDSPHRGHLKTHEIIAKERLPTNPGDAIILRIDRDWFSAPPYYPFRGGRIIL